MHRDRISHPFVLAAVLVAALSAMTGSAYENIDAQSAWKMVTEGQAALVDTRTLEEALWVGTPADAEGRQLATLIPWVTISIAADGTVTKAPNERFVELFTRTFPDKDRPVVLMCRSGGRSAQAALELEKHGYTKLYNLENPGAVGDEGTGRGGFQGARDGHGYRGYPGRGSAEDAVSWQEAGLPVTQKLDQTKIPQ